MVEWAWLYYSIQLKKLRAVKSNLILPRGGKHQAKKT